MGGGVYMWLHSYNKIEYFLYFLFVRFEMHKLDNLLYSQMPKYKCFPFL